LIRIDWKPIVLHGGGIGALLALWVGLWAMGFLVCWDNGWLFPGVEISDRWAESIHYSTEEVLGFLGESLGLDLPTKIPIFLLLMMAVGWVVGAFIASVACLTSLDPGDVGRRTFGWSLRAMVSRNAVPMWVLTIIAAVIPISSGIDNLVFVPPLVFVIWLAFAPMLVWRPVVANGSSLGHWWTPWWPGWKIAGLFLLIEILVLFPEVLFSWIPDGVYSVPGVQLITWPVQLVWWGFSVTAPLLLCSLLMAVAVSTVWRWRWIFTWRTLGPWAALHLWWLTIPIALGPPFLVIYVWFWKFVPVLASAVEGQGEFLPYEYHLVLAAIGFVGNFWWMMVLIPATFFYWLGVARFVSCTDKGCSSC